MPSLYNTNLPLYWTWHSVRWSLRNIFEFQAVFALLLLPKCPWLDCHVSGFFFSNNATPSNPKQTSSNPEPTPSLGCSGLTWGSTPSNLGGLISPLDNYFVQGHFLLGYRFHGWASYVEYLWQIDPSPPSRQQHCVINPKQGCLSGLKKKNHNVHTEFRPLRSIAACETAFR